MGRIPNFQILTSQLGRQPYSHSKSRKFGFYPSRFLRYRGAFPPRQEREGHGVLDSVARSLTTWNGRRRGGRRRFPSGEEQLRHLMAKHPSGFRGQGFTAGEGASSPADPWSCKADRCVSETDSRLADRAMSDERDRQVPRQKGDHRQIRLRGQRPGHVASKEGVGVH